LWKLNLIFDCDNYGQMSIKLTCLVPYLYHGGQ
jgi:hypothetical protein